MWHEYVIAASIDDVLEVLEDKKENARVVAGATDLILEMERGVRKGIDTLVDVTRIPDLNQIRLDEAGIVHIGPLVTHNGVVASKLLREVGLPLARACWEVGSPQIRNRGTIAGNLITASPANDTITPMMALEAEVVLQSKAGTRAVPLRQFYTGVRRSVLQPGEMLVDIRFPALKANQRGTFIKLALRQAQAISVINVAAILDLDGRHVNHAAITLGAVAPTIMHAEAAEAFLQGCEIGPETIARAAELTMEAVRPISDVRSTADYRRSMVRVITRRALTSLANGQERAGFPADPILLMDHRNGALVLPMHERVETGKTSITTCINGKEFTFSTGQDKTLLRLLREEAGLTGTKEGCAEGECGACTVFLDGQAVMSCMVPAPRAHGADIVTVEGLARDGELHPVQKAFMEAGAVQCGYCTPGFLMSGVKLLEERPTPTQEEIRQAITGNLCRCTGYYKIIEAIELASRR
jgi:xanthine dehydrogenase iron-sulfur cluster and FAD-binding subunit A